jgi:hypothetical protein
MESELVPHHTVARAVRVEHDLSNDTIYLVFEVVDEKLKQQIKLDWMQDIELKLIGKELINRE